MDSGKQGCALAMRYEVERSNEKTAPQGITSAVFLDSLLWITLNLMVLYPQVVRTLSPIHAIEKPLLKLLITSRNPQDPQVKMDQ